MPKSNILSWERKTGVGPLEVILDCIDLIGDKSFPLLEVYVESDSAATFLVQSSVDKKIWRTVDTLSVSATSTSQGYDNAFPYVRVKTDDSGTHTIEVVASG